MEFNQTFLELYAFSQTLVVPPIVAWLKHIVPGSFPIQPVVYTFGLSLLTAWALAKWLMPGLAIEPLIGLALAGQGIAQVTRETKKSVDKLRNQ